MNNQEIYKHLINMHGLSRSVIGNELYDANFDIMTVHTDQHTIGGSLDHSHDEAGEVQQSTKTVLNGKALTFTNGGWSFDSTAAEALQELNSIINSHPVEFKFVNEDGVIKGLLYHERKSVIVEGENFLAAVRLLLGEIYNYLHERNQE